MTQPKPFETLARYPLLDALRLWGGASRGRRGYEEAPR